MIHIDIVPGQQRRDRRHQALFVRTAHRSHSFANHDTVANQRDGTGVRRGVDGEDVHASGDRKPAVVVVAGNVFETEAQRIVRQSDAGALGPFDKHDLTAVENVIPANIREIFWSVQPIKVEMVDGCAVHFILVHERERRAGHIFTDSKSATDRLGERCLAGAKITLECDGYWWPYLPPEAFPPVA
jgi:hypothetical protein